MKFPSFPFVVLDTETTGFVPRVHKIIEFASMRVQEGEVVNEYEELFYAKEVPPVVEVLTRIKTPVLVDKPLFEDRIDRMREAIGPDTLIVGQNVGFDLGMLKGQGIDLTDRPWIDTSMLASLVFPELESYSLGYLSAVLQLNHHPVHRALGDVRATLELLGKCWERLCEMPEDLLQPVRAIMAQSTPGYRLLFEALPQSHNTVRPLWLDAWRDVRDGEDDGFHVTIDVSSQDQTITLLEEPLDPAFLRHAIRHIGEHKDTRHWVAVKNLELAAARLHQAEREAVRIVYPPYLLLDPAAGERLLHQETFTADEATLAAKLRWYAPRLRADFPLHGGEEAVWNGKVACTVDTQTYRAQFDSPPSVLLIDHRQLLKILIETDEGRKIAMEKGLHIIIDDASMLEDTATKAFGWYCAIDDVRAAAEGDETLTKFMDVLQLWIEKVRAGRDLHYLAMADLSHPDARGLREQLDDLLTRQTYTSQVRSHLECLKKIVDPENLRGRIVWIELRQNGSQLLHAAPEHVGAMLKDTLFDAYHTTLFVPTRLADTLKEVLPPSGAHVVRSPESDCLCSIDISFEADPPLDGILTSPPEGKTVVLIPSKGTIENLYVKYAEDLEERGIGLICQGVSGGQGRMQAEFLAAPTPVLWLLTPWTFEGIELPPKTIDHLVLLTLPFDHPSHPVLSKRALRYRNSFTEYLLPRLSQRLFRLLRTFCRFRTPAGDVRILDERLHSKAYGKTLREYLATFTPSGKITGSASEKEKKEPQGKKETPTKQGLGKKKDEGQMSMF